MPISFQLTKNSLRARDHYNRIALDHMRPLSRKADVEEHELPREWVDYWWR